MIFALALAGHLIGDWIVQTDTQALRKTESWGAMAGHMLTYHLTLGVFLAAVLSAGDLAIVLAVSTATHAFLDRRWPVRWLLRHTGSPDFAETTLGVLAADQALHIAVLAVSLALVG